MTEEKTLQQLKEAFPKFRFSNSVFGIPDEEMWDEYEFIKSLVPGLTLIVFKTEDVWVMKFTTQQLNSVQTLATDLDGVKEELSKKHNTVELPTEVETGYYWVKEESIDDDWKIGEYNGFGTWLIEYGETLPEEITVVGPKIELPRAYI